MEVLKERYSITELSKELNITDHALRYYEKEFELKIPRDNRGRRFYPTEAANLFYQIRNMREEGLEIKAIKTILDSEYSSTLPPPVVYDAENEDEVTDLSLVSSTAVNPIFNNLSMQLTENIKAEIVTSQASIVKEILKSKLEIGACVENSSRRLEYKLDRHFNEVDRLLTGWREKKNRGIFNKSSKSLKNY